MSENVVGIVEEVNNNGKGKGSNLRIAGAKYGVFDPTESGLDTVSVGTTVSLRYKEKDAGGGIVYKNVQGKITTVKDGTPLTPSSVELAVTKSTKSGYRKNGEEGGFPIHAKAYERALDRRNAIAVAAKMVIANGGDETAMFELASRIEAYTTGDDVAEAELKLAFENDTIDE